MSALAQPASARIGVSDDYGTSDEPSWRDLRWKNHLRSVELGRAWIAYVELGAGDGPPIVLLHGIGGCWQNWIQNIPRLARARRVIALDLPGFGGSTLPRRPVTLSYYARIVDLLCERLDTGRVVLVGNSMGGMVAAEVAARFEGRVEHLALVAPAGVSTGSLRHTLAIGTRLVTLQSRRLHRLVGRFGVGAGEHPLALLVAHPELLERDLRRAALAPGAAKLGFGLVALNRFVDVGMQGRLFTHLRAIACPTLIVWGDEDRINPVGDAAVFAELLADSRTVLIDHCGHTPMLERPRAFNRLLLEFAEGLSRG